jgi:L-alanine-DL-glutamate epimerase-like enolase superfamily enzyme
MDETVKPGGGAASRVERVEVRLLSVPLKRPYRLAFGDLLAFDTLLVEVFSRDGRRGFGEATVLTGYTHETIQGIWLSACELADLSVNEPLAALQGQALDAAAKSPALATAFQTALEMLQSTPALDFDDAVAVPLLGLLNAIDDAEIVDEVDSLLDQGFKTLKVKVGIAGVNDLRRISSIQRAVSGRARIRIDANQAFTADGAVEFLSALEPQDIELFEQPCAADDWEAHAAASRVSRVPMMLDESIFSLRDIDRAADERLAAYVKVKLVKFGSMSAVTRAIGRIRERGMKPVLGNGVACDIGCWMEACVAARHIDNAGEMNGHLKTLAPLFANPMQFEGGSIKLSPNYRPELDRQAVEKVTVTSYSGRTKVHGSN